VYGIGSLAYVPSPAFSSGARQILPNFMPNISTLSNFLPVLDLARISHNFRPACQTTHAGDGNITQSSKEGG